MEVVEVVNCKDCKFFTGKYMIKDELAGRCELHKEIFMFGSDFCSYGKQTSGKIVYEGKEIRY